MRYAFSPAGLRELEALRGHDTLFAFDFDGTLAPIVADPRRARIPAGTRRLLARLAAAAPVVGVSGRRARELRALVPASFRAWAGDHGAEILPGRLQRVRAASSARAAVRAWQRRLARSLAGLPGVWIERKSLSLAVHFRRSRRPREVRREILRAAASLRPAPRLLPGKMVVNLLVPGLPHKGDAVRALMVALGLPHALYVGDDANDEDVFALADPRIRTLRVGRLPSSRASLYLRGRGEIDRLLRLLLSLQGSRTPRYRGRREKKQKREEQSCEEQSCEKAVDRNRPGRHEDRRRDGRRRRAPPRHAARAHPPRKLARAA